MRRLAFAVLALSLSVPGPVLAQTWGQPHVHALAWPPSITELAGRAYAATGRAATGHANGYAYGAWPGYGGGYGDPHAYRPPVRYGYEHDRGGRYSDSRQRSGDWTRGSSPPGRGYHDVGGYNDDRAPRGADHRRYQRQHCDCEAGAYLYDR